ncbi:MAG: phosphopantothenoylcysteine decarboxylase [Candidatus Omnitrophota bacterium]
MVTKRSLKNKKVLVTCGPTWVAIDDMRVISNRSTGTLGHLITKELIKEGALVTLLQGPTTDPANCKPKKIIPFLFFEELKRLLSQELKKGYDVVIHAAAVSDYKLRKTYSAKLSSHIPRLTLKLTPTEKLIERIKKICPRAFLVGFKLESDISKNLLLTKAGRLFTNAGCGLVIANTFDKNGYRSYILGSKKNVLGQAKTKTVTARKIIQTLKRCL